MDYMDDDAYLNLEANHEFYEDIDDFEYEKEYLKNQYSSFNDMYDEESDRFYQYW